MENGLIVIGDLPREKNEGSKTYSKGKQWLNGTLEREVGLENALPERWWLKGALKRK